MTGLDARIFYATYAARSGAFTGFALLLSAIGGGYAMLGLLPLYVVRRWRRFASTFTLVLAASAALVFVVKLAVSRPRPCVSLSGVHALCVAPTDPSFPSGHACGSFTALAFLLVVLHAPGTRRMTPWARAFTSAALTVLALGIAWSRVYLGVHFPTDVAAGAMLGLACGSIGGRLYVTGTPEPRA